MPPLGLMNQLSEPLYGLREGDRYIRNYRMVLRHPLVLGRWSRAKGTPAEVMRGFRDIVYFASRDRNAPSQILKWFRYGFLNAERTLIVGKLHESVAQQHIEGFEHAGLNYLLYRYVRDLDFSTNRAVFYPYNTMWNPAVVSQRGPQHVFLGHGESDKAASVNPMIRLYDRIFISGQLAAERLLAAKIINTEDLTSGRVVKVGMPYLPRVDADKEQRSYVLYAPTWEGMSGQEYSSLHGGFGEKLIAFLLEKTQLDVVFRPHPSTGIMRSRYREYVGEIISAFAASPRFRLHLDSFEQSAVDKSLTRGAEYCGLEQSMAGARWVISDISSVLSAAVSQVIPFFVVLHEKDCKKVGLAELAAGDIQHQKEPSDNVAEILGSKAHWTQARLALSRQRESCMSVEDSLKHLRTDQQLDAALGFGTQKREGQVSVTPSVTP